MRGISAADTQDANGLSAGKSEKQRMSNWSNAIERRRHVSQLLESIHEKAIAKHYSRKTASTYVMCAFSFGGGN